MTRGLTMVETLLSVALLAMVMIGGAQWLNVAASMQSGITDSPTWRHTAQRTLDLVHDSIRAGDEPTLDPLTRVQVGDEELQIATRSIAGTEGPQRHEYVLDSFTNQLTLNVRTKDGQQSTHLLLQDVEQWHCELDEELLILRVVIVSLNGESVVRRMRL